MWHIVWSGSCLMKNIQHISHNDWQHLFQKKHFYLFISVEWHSIHGILLMPSILTIIVYVYSLGRKFCCTYCLTENLSTKKCANACKKIKKNLRGFSTILLVWKYATITKTQQYLKISLQTRNFIKECPTQMFFFELFQNY